MCVCEGGGTTPSIILQTLLVSHSLLLDQHYNTSHFIIEDDSLFHDRIVCSRTTHTISLLINIISNIMQIWKHWDLLMSVHVYLTILDEYMLSIIKVFEFEMN